MPTFYPVPRNFPMIRTMALYRYRGIICSSPRWCDATVRVLDLRARNLLGRGIVTPLGRSSPSMHFSRSEKELRGRFSE